MIPMRRCKCTAGSKAGRPARCSVQTRHHSGYCKECRHRCCSLQRHNLDHSVICGKCGSEAFPAHPCVKYVYDLSQEGKATK